VPNVRVFVSRWFQRYARKERISDTVVLEATDRAERGQIDADLGGGVIKQRIARTGEGRSGGYRVIVIFRPGQRAVFMYGFRKSDRENIRPDEEQLFKEAAGHVLALTDKQLAELVSRGDFREVGRI
jgi:hypothetical protein